MTPRLTRRTVAFLLVFVTVLAWGAPARAADKPVLLYSRYFNAKGGTRYLPDGTYKDVLAKLADTFDVRTSEEPLTIDTLRGVSLVLIANPDEKAVGKNPPPHHCSAEDVAALTAFVNAGGGVVVMGNQENHNLETKDFNNLLGAFGMKWVANYTDAKQLNIPKSVPVIGGLRWAYYTGNQVVLDAGNAARPVSLVDNDLTQKPVGGPRDAAGCLLAVATPGRGHFVAVTDAGWISNDALSGKGIGNVSIKDQDNFEMCLRLFRWAAGR